MSALLATALGLAVAGLDPAGALIAVAALARGVTARAVLLYAAIVVAGTAVLGTVLSLTLGQRLARVDWLDLLPKGDGGALFELAVAAALLVWAVARARRPGARPKRPGEERSGGTAGLAGVGALFALSAVLDPTFVGLVVIAGRDEPAGAAALAHLLWVLISQAPLIAIAAAVALGAHHRLVARFERAWARVAPGVRVGLTVVLALAGLVVAADALTQLATGRFLILPDAGS